MEPLERRDFDRHCDAIAAALAEEGRIVLPQVLAPALTAALAERVALRQDSMQRAAVGRDRTRSDAVRNDRSAWLEADDASERAFLEWMEDLRLGLNRRLFLGLFDYEAHFAVYDAGAYYRRHLDVFQERHERVVTTVFYLNRGWPAAAGGELLIYPPQGDQPLQSVRPDAGTLVVFLSERFPHEVRPATARRYSIAGWFRRNGGGSRRADPPR